MGEPRLRDCTGFQWDDGNSAKNWHKHSVSQSECEQVFFHRPLVTLDQQHSMSESRYFALGETNAGRAMFVVFTIRGTLIRVISARDMSRKERRIHEQAEEDGA